MKIPRFQYEFHVEDPVIFSRKTETLALTAPDTLDPSSSLSVGPLCRRLLLSIHGLRLEKAK